MRGPLMSGSAIATTRPCTVVFFNEDQNFEDLVLQDRLLSLDYKPKSHLFKADLSMKTAEVKEILEDLQRGSRMGNEELKEDSREERRERTPRDHQVNELRNKIAQVIRQHTTPSFKGVAKQVGCYVSTVKSVYLQLFLVGQPQQYHYENIKPSEVVARLDHLIADPSNTYLTTIDYKRRVPECSKVFIRRRLRAAGLKYKKLAREPREDKKRSFNKTQLRGVIWTAVQALARDDETMLFLDEAIFPCFQTSTHCWQRDEQHVIYNRRQSDDTLHVIALCSHKRYVAFQVLTREPNKECIHYFLTEVLKRLEDKKKVVILLDNAGWHVANLVRNSSVSKVLLFNTAYCWQSNFIENTFSKMKALWRRRRLATTVEEEVETVVDMFRRGWTRRDFDGYRRQYYRQLKELMAEL